MASIQKRQTRSGAPAYIVKWKTPDGKHRTRGGFSTRKAAQAYATEVAHAQQRGNTFDPAAGQITFRQQAELWLQSRHDLKPTTRSSYRYMLAPVKERQGDGKTLGIDAVFGGYPLNALKRQAITDWVAKLAAVGKKPATVRQNVKVVRMVLAQAVADGRIPFNPAAHVKLPNLAGHTGVADDPAKFLTAQQVMALVNATPWPYNVLVHVAAWSGLRAGELAGLRLGDVNLNSPNTTGQLNVQRSVASVDGKLVYLPPKTKGSKRKVPLTAATTAVLRDYLKRHPRAADPLAPLFPAIRLTGSRKADQVELDWAQPLRHTTFYAFVFKPAVLRAGAAVPPQLAFHSLRHTYVSLCVAAGIPPLEISRFVGHSTVTTTLGIYAHLFESDHSAAMGKLGAIGSAPATNVVPLRAVPG
jgi:integrase